MRKSDTDKVRDYRERQKADGWVRLEMYVPKHMRAVIRRVVLTLIEALEQKGDRP